MIFEITAILLTILLGLCILALARDIAHFCSTGRWKQYLKLRKRERQILLTSRVKCKIFPVILFLAYVPLLIFATYLLSKVHAGYILTWAFIYFASCPYVAYCLWCMPKVVDFIQVSSEALILHRLFTQDDRIPLSDIEQIRVATPGKNQLFTFGNLGLFGYFGKWSDDVNGAYTAYIGRKDQCILVKTKTGFKYMLSCKRYKEVVELVQERIK